jgi:hypothetical protein
MAGSRIVGVVLLVAFSWGCSGWVYGPPGVVGQGVSVPSVDEGQRFDLFVTGLGIFGVAYLLCQVPMAIAAGDGLWSIPVAGPFIRWSEYSGSGFSVLVNVFGVVFAVGELTGLTLFLVGLLSEPDS